MEKIVNLVMEKTGISESQAQTAVKTVVNFLKEKMPESMAGQVDAYLSGEGNPGGSLGDAAGKLGGMFGKK